MTVRTIALFFLFFIPVRLLAQLMPADAAVVNYRLIGFSFPAEKGAKEYKIEIATGKITAESEFAGKVVTTATSATNKVIAEVPSFGMQYTWRVVVAGPKGKVGSLHHFSTVMNARVDTSMSRLRILQHGYAAKDQYVLVESVGVIYDMKGNPVWSLADTLYPGGYMNSVRVTPEGTMTFFYKKTGYEVNYDGIALWKMPMQDSICKKVPGSYHHEILKLANGHHLALGVEDLRCEKIAGGSGAIIKATTPRPGYRRNVGTTGNRAMGTFSTLLEFDEQGKLAWTWKSSDYLLTSDFAYYTPLDSTKPFMAVANSFYFDEKNGAIYVTFRDLSRIVKVAYPAGNVLAVYGEQYKKGIQQKGNGVFCNPHNISRTQDGDLCVYSNSACYGQEYQPQVVTMHEPVAPTDELRTTWEYTVKTALRTGVDIPESGSAQELPDHSFLVCTGKPEYSRLLLVNKDKKTLWSAMPEYYDTDTKRFINPEEYRSMIISRSTMEQMIWAANK